MKVGNTMLQPNMFIYSLLLQAYIAMLTVDQCHKLILEAYGQVGGINVQTW